MKPVRECKRLDWGGKHINEIKQGMAPAHERGLRVPRRFHTNVIAIKCIDCKKRHEIFTQDKHQVKRCTACQRRMRNARPKKRSVNHEKVIRRGKKRRSRRPEPAIPEFDRGPASESNDTKLVI